MDHESALSSLNKLEYELYSLDHAAAALYFDAVTSAPKGSSEGRGHALSYLGGERYRKITSPASVELIRELSSCAEKDSLAAKRAANLLKQADKIAKIPEKEYTESIKLKNDAENAWYHAKTTDDYALFAPYLEKLVDFSVRFAKYYDAARPVYNVMLEEYEPGADMAMLDSYFADIKSAIVPMVNEVSQRNGGDQAVSGVFDVERQRKLSDMLMNVLMMDMEHCSISETEHPFTTAFNQKDVRITTKYIENDLLSSMYSVIHECGHAIYEMGISDDLFMASLATGASMGIHESQSRLFENIIGRSREFISLVFPRMVSIFPELGSRFNTESFYRSVNRSYPSLIRTDADELTYSLHIMVRYEMEKNMMSKNVPVKELPLMWNELYKKYLGVNVPNDRCGILQDSHWGSGSFGYFPSYSLGSAYASQMFAAMKKDMDTEKLIYTGKLGPIIDWLRQKLHRYGSAKKPSELLLECCGEGFKSEYYIEYLKEKFSSIYGF